jgi:hypothetical protein
MREGAVLHRVLLACSRGATRLFRVNTGKAWQGHGSPVICHRDGMVVTLNRGDVVLRQAQPLEMGLTKGGSDLIGWTSHRVTSDDLGQTLALFTAIETKSDTGRVRPEQVVFIDAVKDAGGIAGVARSEEEALELIYGGAKRR